jgi:arylsulfatase
MCGIRAKNYKALYTAKDTWLGQEQSLKIPALYDLWWDPGENCDIVFNGADSRRFQDLARALFRPG